MGRRSTKDDPLEKTGFQIRRSVLQAAFVERALVRELREIRRRRIYEAYAEAADDPAFREDMSSTSTAFDVTAGDGLGESG